MTGIGVTRFNVSDARDVAEDAMLSTLLRPPMLDP